MINIAYSNKALRSFFSYTLQLPALILPATLIFCSMSLTHCGGDKQSASNGSAANSEAVAESAGSNSPATTTEASAIMDLANFPLMKDAERPSQQTLANLSYQVPGNVKDAYTYHQQKLIEKGWKELPQSYISDQSSSGTFAYKGFKISVSVMPSYSKTGMCDVIVQQHGNVDLSKLPLAPNLSPVAIFPLTAIYSTTNPLEATAEANQSALISAGWAPYGFAGETRYFKKNAVHIGVTTSSPPAQAGKTMVSLVSTLLSADFPVPPEIDEPDYRDLLQKLSFTTVLPREKIFEFYRQALPKMGWTVSLDKTTQIDDNEVLTFRNAARDLATLSIGKGPGIALKVSLELQTKAQIDEMNKRLDAQAAAYKAKNQGR